MSTWIERRAAAVPRALPRISDLEVERGEGATLHTSAGELIDLASGIGVTSLGHGHPEVLAAVAEQVERLQHVCIHVGTYAPYVELCERLNARFPHHRPGGATKSILFNSGAEAVENALKIARQATGRQGVLCYTGAFHGRTLLCMSLTSKVGYKRGCGPFAPEVYRLPYPSPFHRAAGRDEDAFVRDELALLERALHDTVAPEQVAAVVIEVVQGEGGFIPCPPGYLRGLREVCDREGIVLIFDEVQSGFCRTGRWAAYEHAGVAPDLSTWAKAMGSGFPISAVIGEAELMDAASPGTLGGTFGGNPVSCAAALATLEVMEREDLCARARRIGQRIRARLEPLRERSPWVGDVRGLGAMQALELVEERDPARPAAQAAAQVLARCHARGLLVISAGIEGNVIRLLPPLTIEDAQLDAALDVLVHALEELEEGLSPGR